MRIGVDLGGTKIEGILLSPDGRIAGKIRVDTPAQKYLETVDALCAVIEQLQQLSSIDLQRVYVDGKYSIDHLPPCTQTE